MAFFDGGIHICWLRVTTDCPLTRRGWCIGLLRSVAFDMLQSRLQNSLAIKRARLAKIMRLELEKDFKRVIVARPSRADQLDR